jgi:phenylpropionate dioxygenase-like ring-hydroxylating dioxygenase large terminal subunit
METSPNHFPVPPASWYYLGAVRHLANRPIGTCIEGRDFVGYQTEAGAIAVLSGRCSHFGARLSNGFVRGDRLVCPLHGWEYGPDGICKRIPAGDPIPAFARQSSYPVEVRGGHAFFFNRAQIRFPLPFFEGVSAEDLLPAKSFDLLAESPWYFVGANGFDIQHFRMAHDRTLIGEPEVSSPSQFARRIVARFEVSGKSAQDRLTRCFAGPRVEMDITIWCGTLIFVRAAFARTTSFGLFNVLPIDAQRTLGRVIVWVKRSKTAIARHLIDPANAGIRRLFIRTFLRSDLPRIAGLRYQPANLIAADAVLADYFAWLKKVAEPAPAENL